MPSEAELLASLARSEAELAAGQIGSRGEMLREPDESIARMEARLSAIEGRIANFAAGQNSHELAIMRIADTQADHTARMTRIETLLTNVAQKLGV